MKMPTSFYSTSKVIGYTKKAFYKVSKLIEKSNNESPTRSINKGLSANNTDFRCNNHSSSKLRDETIFSSSKLRDEKTPG